jgi:hypothetical protein
MEGVSKLPALDPEDFANRPSGVTWAAPDYARHFGVIQPEFGFAIERLNVCRVGPAEHESHLSRLGRGFRAAQMRVLHLKRDCDLCDVPRFMAGFTGNSDQVDAEAFVDQKPHEIAMASRRRRPRRTGC